MGATEWAAKIDHIDRLMAISRIDHLIVALPLPQDDNRQVALKRIVAVKGAVSLIDVNSPHPVGKTRLNPAVAPRIQLAAKLAIDRLGAAFLLIVLSPLMLAVAASIRLTSPGPAFFVQRRLGLDNTVIPVVKFRTMYLDRGDPTGGKRTIPDDPRVTALGAILRRWSLDELPQLFNVVAGHMSLVGPRPHAVMMKAGKHLYFEAVPGYLARHRVKPGITGWAQVNRLCGQVTSATGGKERLTYDLYYIDHWSIWLDLKIFWKTLGVFFDRVDRY